MKTLSVKFSIILIAALSLTSCSEKSIDGSRTPGINKADAGVLVGGATGAVVGHQFGNGSGNALATLGGAVIGGIAGHAIGNSMDQPDKEQYAYSNARPANVSPYHNILEYNKTGETSDWTNINGKMVQVVPTSTYKNTKGQNCRNYTQINTNGTQNFGSACRQSDGTWI